MKLEKGQQIYVSNWIMKPHSEVPNSGFVKNEFKTKPEVEIVEYPGAYLAIAPASVARDNEVCNRCKRLYRFNNHAARAQCECRGEQIK